MRNRASRRYPASDSPRHDVANPTLAPLQHIAARYRAAARQRRLPWAGLRLNRSSPRLMTRLRIDRNPAYPRQILGAVRRDRACRNHQIGRLHPRRHSILARRLLSFASMGNLASTKSTQSMTMRSIWVNLALAPVVHCQIIPRRYPGSRYGSLTRVISAPLPAFWCRPMSMMKRWRRRGAARTAAIYCRSVRVFPYISQPRRWKLLARSDGLNSAPPPSKGHRFYIWNWSCWADRDCKFHQPNSDPGFRIEQALVFLNRVAIGHAGQIIANDPIESIPRLLDFFQGGRRSCRGW